ncbi:GNAT family N-acetyltransferase [Aliikangiella coralliicola]|uniref:GNAT family N-acetyltransferase n=1 Tax=Aliikangiella coralliicola TaxID=2592383 RepID=A0A545U5V8_9GAMM|nr:GNAT family N-acetyltransferase [Aliikangiella coralliicola]TQV84854.1 GNAT family N-acetyltransferase [Aliikangiella coralliicola]
MLDIRQANTEDIELIFQWTLQLHHHEDDGELKAHADFPVHLKQWLSGQLEDTGNLCLIAEVDAQPIGFILASSIINDNGFLESPAKGIIQLLWINEDHRKQHIADTLVSEIEQCFISVGIGYIECNYTSHNNLAKSFWDKQGYLQRTVTARKMLKLPDSN